MTAVATDAGAVDLFANVRGPLVSRPWPFAALLAASGHESVAELARCLRLPPTTVRTAVRCGLTDAQSDDWAIRAGYHPAEVWPDWYSLDIESPS